eukprot:GHUV01012249.1.p1 GENE.GHUV01012249.1~~GHUV01012249.1.p1  ORF type:complete len:353 (+),score=103.53 GHUV01012249.1:1564-2622(+)
MLALHTNMQRNIASLSIALTRPVITASKCCTAALHQAAALNPPLLLPSAQVKGKPLTSATIRTGPGYMEVPFVATHENKRGRGFGRCIVEAIEEVARALNVGRLLLCSTREESVSSTWKHLGFFETSEEQLHAWNVDDGDLVHMQNTLQMHKEVPPPRAWRPLIIRHQAFVARVYMPADKQALSGKSMAARPFRHDMGAVSGYKSSRATSAVTNGSYSNASYGGGEQQQNGQQRNLQEDAAAADGRANGFDHHHQQQEQQSALNPVQQPEQQPVEEQHQQAMQQPVDTDDIMLIDQPTHIIDGIGPGQPQYLLDSTGPAESSDVGLVHLGDQQQQEGAMVSGAALLQTGPGG